MRKSKTMRAAMILLVLVLITSCFVGSTFAKYVATASASSTARVAYWGFNSTETVELGLFDFEDAGILDGETNLIAPGSEHEIELKLVPKVENADKAPEVAYKVQIDTNNSVSPTYDTFGGTDGRIEWHITVGDETTTYTTWSAFIKGIGALDGNASGYGSYAPGEKAPILFGGDNTVKIGWKWVFEKYDTNSPYMLLTENDATDTLTGNKALTSYGNVKLNINITVEQLNASA